MKRGIYYDTKIVGSTDHDAKKTHWFLTWNGDSEPYVSNLAANIRDNLINYLKDKNGSFVFQINKVDNDQDDEDDYIVTIAISFKKADYRPYFYFEENFPNVHILYVKDPITVRKFCSQDEGRYPGTETVYYRMDKENGKYNKKVAKEDNEQDIERETLENELNDLENILEDALEYKEKKAKTRVPGEKRILVKPKYTVDQCNNKISRIKEKIKLLPITPKIDINNVVSSISTIDLFKQLLDERDKKNKKMFKEMLYEHYQEMESMIKRLLETSIHAEPHKNENSEDS